MNNFRGKFETIFEETLYRFQQGGFLGGDYVKFKDDALQDPVVKSMSEQMKNMIQSLIKSKALLRVSYIKSGKSEGMSGPVDASNIPSGTLWADVVVEYAPGMWKDPMTLPMTTLEKLSPNSDAEGYVQYPDSIKRPNRTDNDESSAEKELDNQTKGKDSERKLADKNKKLEHTPAPKDGREKTKLRESQSWKADTQAITEVYNKIPGGSPI